MSEPCVTWRDRVGGMLDPEAPTADAGAFIAHLPGCPGCRAVVEQVIRCERLLYTAAVHGVPQQVPERRGSSTSTIRRVTTVRRRRARPVSFMPWVAGVAALLAVAVLVGVMGRSPSSTAFATVESATTLSLADGQSLRAGATLNAGSELRGGPAQVRLADGTRLWLDADSRLSLTSNTTLRGGARAGVLVRLDDGAVGVSAKPQDPTAPLAVQTPLAESVVVGTAFRVAHDESGSELTVSNGTVKLLSKDGERLVTAGSHARVEIAPPPATLIASFSASSVVGTTEPGAPLKGWSGNGTLVALPPSGSQQPILRQLGKGYGLCFNGRDQRLATTVNTFSAQHGVTLIALVIPINPGRDQPVVTLSDGGRERLALVRHDLTPGAIASTVEGKERVRIDVPVGKHWSVACRWQADGSVVLNAGSGPGKRVAASVPTAMSAPQLTFGGSPSGRALEGDIIAVELHAGVLDDAALAARVRALASANRFPLSGW
jgi:ferric-dicitrate binding protein FerR (iron transport regulator)